MALEQVPTGDQSTDDLIIDEDEQAEAVAKPDDPPLPPMEWAKENLFSTPLNAVLTVLAGALTYFALRGLLGFIWNPERNWASVATNMRLLLVRAYPDEQMNRIWVGLAVFLVLAGLTIGLSRAGAKLPQSRVIGYLRNVGIALLAVGLISPSTIPTRIPWLVAGAILVAAWFGLKTALGDQARFRMVPMVPVVFGVLALLIGSMWVVPYGFWGFFDGELIADPDSTVAYSTKFPWTMMWVALVAAWIAGRALAGSTIGDGIRRALPVLWLLSPFFVTWVILRDPDLDWDHVFSTDIPMFLGFAVVGGAILYWLSDPERGETGRIIAAGLVLFALSTWLFAFFGWRPLWPMLQKARISFLLLGLFAIAAPTFAGERAKRLRFAASWVGVMAVLHYFATMMNTASTLQIAEASFLGGATLSLFVATITMLFSFPLGVLLALARTSKMPIFRVLSTTFIEVVRGVPLITILFFFLVGMALFLPDGMELSEVALACIGFSLFSAAYLAENVRGGLQSVGKGQYEAADALGLSGAQRTGLIVLPQALRVSIPPLVGQLIATYKETSLLAIVGFFDLLRIADKVVSQQSFFLGFKKESLLFVCLLYWIVAFSMSKYSQSLERKLGLGTR